MPAKKDFSTAEEAAEYIEFLRRRNIERAKEFHDNKIKADTEKYVKNIVIIFIIKISI